jgi:hypothetical protein
MSSASFAIVAGAAVVLTAAVFDCEAGGGHRGGIAARSSSGVGAPARAHHFHRRSGPVFIGGAFYAWPRAYYYPAPYYYAPPGPMMVDPYWYYCPGAAAYYPYVHDCPGGWEPVLPTPAPHG